MVAMEMTFRATAMARPSLPFTLSCATRAYSLPEPTHKAQFRSLSVPLQISTTISGFALFTASNRARAFSFSKDRIITSLIELENAIDQAQEVCGGVLHFFQCVLHLVIDALKPGVDVTLPILQKAGDQALKIASPAISEASKKAQEAIHSSGVDAEPVLRAAKIVADAAQLTIKVIEELKPMASSTVETILSVEPLMIVETSGALFLTYLLFPSIWLAISFSLRGYKGEYRPAQTLDLIFTQKYLLIDIRSEKDKSNAGIPCLPSSAKNKMISIPLEELPIKIRELVRNTKKVEAGIATLKISYLKRVNKGSNIVIMDSYSDSAKLVARALTNLGFKNCWIMAGGFSGKRGWLQSQLGTESYNVSVAGVLPPSQVVPASVRRSDR